MSVGKVDSQTGASPGIPKAAIEMRGLITGYFVSRAIQVAAELDVATYLGKGDKNCVELAALCGAHAPSLCRLMRLLVSIGVFSESNGRFMNNEMSELLRDDVLQSMRALARFYGADLNLSPAQAMIHSIRTGDSAFQHVFGEETFSYLSRHPDKAKVFDEAMVSSSEQINRAIIDAYDFSSLTSLADIAGGYGSTLCEILTATPKLVGILFDLPHVVEKAKDFVTSRGLISRCSLVGGNFLEAVPQRADAYFMKHIIHDWDDERCLQLLHNCHVAMPGHAKLLVCEKVLPEGNAATYTRILDIVMLLNTPGGRERTEPEYRALFEKAGFRLTQAIPTQVENWILEAEKV